MIFRNVILCCDIRDVTHDSTTWQRSDHHNPMKCYRITGNHCINEQALAARRLAVWPLMYGGRAEHHHHLLYFEKSWQWQTQINNVRNKTIIYRIMKKTSVNVSKWTIVTRLIWLIRTIKSRSFRSAVFGISSLSCRLALRLYWVWCCCGKTSWRTWWLLIKTRWKKSIFGITE